MAERKARTVYKPTQPCPFCDSPPGSLSIGQMYSIPGFPYRVRCFTCGTEGPGGSQYAKFVAERWDTWPLPAEEKAARLAEIDAAEPDHISVAYWDGEAMPELEEGNDG